VKTGKSNGLIQQATCPNLGKVDEEGGCDTLERARGVRSDVTGLQEQYDWSGIMQQVARTNFFPRA